MGSCDAILTNDLHVKRVYAKFVPRLLTDDQREQRQKIAGDFFEHSCKDMQFLKNIVTGDESWSMGTTQRQNGNHHSGRVPCLCDQNRGTRCEAKQRSCYWRFLILRVSYITSMLPTGRQLTMNSTWRSYDVCMNQFTKNDRKNGGMATGSFTTTMHQHTLHALCSSFWPDTARLSCSSHHTHHISHHVTFFYSQGLRKF